MHNIYSSPEQYGLTTAGEIEWSDACYQFDLTVVWRRNADGQLLFAEDSGCSCPSPFESHGMLDLVPCSAAELQAHLEKRSKENVACNNDAREAEITDLMYRLKFPSATHAESPTAEP